MKTDEYSPLMLQKSREILKVYRKRAETYLKEEEIRETWFCAVEERMRIDFYFNQLSSSEKLLFKSF